MYWSIIVKITQWINVYVICRVYKTVKKRCQHGKQNNNNSWRVFLFVWKSSYIEGEEKKKREVNVKSLMDRLDSLYFLRRLMVHKEQTRERRKKRRRPSSPRSIFTPVFFPSSSLFRIKIENLVCCLNHKYTQHNSFILIFLKNHYF